MTETDWPTDRERRSRLLYRMWWKCCPGHRHGGFKTPPRRGARKSRGKK